MNAISLSGKWKLTGFDTREKNPKTISLDATVPGAAMLDLSAAGYLPADLYMGMNITEGEKFESFEWTYTKEFELDEVSPRSYLVFDGVDCIADYYLNGELIGESENAFIPHEFEVSRVLRRGKNTLCVNLKSITQAAFEADYDLLTTAVTWKTDHAAAALRRPAHSFGWDIMPRAVSPAIFGDVRIEVKDPVRFRDTFFDFENGIFSFVLDGEWEDFYGISVEGEGVLDDSRFTFGGPVSSRASHFEFKLKNPKLWWPRNYGKQNLYSVTLKILREGEVIHTKNTRVGVRTVRLDRTETTDGKHGRFRFIVNGVEIMCLGTNWVPLDAFAARYGERYDRALALLSDVGCNMVRVWGGDHYEGERFYNFCDENGIMVWQDFAFACHVYPEDEASLRVARDEAAYIVRQLRHHPSLVLWAGDNEVDVMLDMFHVPPSTNRLSREVLKDAVRRNDLGRPYLESSPFISDKITLGEELYMPEDHLWGPRDYFKSSYYKDSRSHFVSETGYHGCPSLNSIKKFITEDKISDYHNNEEWILHSSDQSGNDFRVMIMEEHIRQLFGEVPTDISEYIEASQISQAEAKKFFIERVRSQRPYKSGILWWNLLDGWPQMSDAVVDYYFDKKKAYDYIKRSQSPFAIVAGEIDNWGLKFFACNDTIEDMTVSYRIIDTDTESVVAEGNQVFSANMTTTICKIPVYYSDKKMFIMEWEANGTRGFNHYLCGYPPFSLEKYKTLMKKYSL